MNTYRAYVLDTTIALEPIVHVVYLRADKYGPAWQGANHALSGGDKATDLFTEADCKVLAKIKPGDHVKCAKIDDIRPRNVKVDKTALKALLADPKASDADKLAAMAKLLGA